MNLDLRGASPCKVNPIHHQSLNLSGNSLLLCCLEAGFIMTAEIGGILCRCPRGTHPLPLILMAWLRVCTKILLMGKQNIDDCQYLALALLVSG